jgi:hypothetical protein
MQSCEESCQLTISWPLLDQRPGRRKLARCTPPALQDAWAQDFVANLARANKEYKEIKTTVDAAYGNHPYRKRRTMPPYKTVKACKPTADNWHLNSKKQSALQPSSPLSLPPMKKLAAANGDNR